MTRIVILYFQDHKDKELFILFHNRYTREIKILLYLSEIIRSSTPGYPIEDESIINWDELMCNYLCHFLNYQIRIELSFCQKRLYLRCRSADNRGNIM